MRKCPWQCKLVLLLVLVGASFGVLCSCIACSCWWWSEWSERLAWPGARVQCIAGARDGCGGRGDAAASARASTRRRRPFRRDGARRADRARHRSDTTRPPVQLLGQRRDRAVRRLRNDAVRATDGQNRARAAVGRRRRRLHQQSVLSHLSHKWCCQNGPNPLGLPLLGSWARLDAHQDRLHH